MINSLAIYSIIQNLDPSQKQGEGLIKHLKTKSRKLIFKEDKSTDRLMISLDYENINEELTVLERECRNIILSYSSLNIICFTFDEMYQNNYDLLQEYKDHPKIFQECIEGTMITAYNFNNKWFFSTRRCLDAKNSHWTNKKNHYDMLLDSLNCEEDYLLKTLNPDYYYLFVLTHHENKFIVNYETRFNNPTYKRVYLSNVKKSDTHNEVENIDLESIFFQKLEVYEPTIYNNMDLLDTEKSGDINNVTYQGLLVKIKTENKIINIRFLTDNYKLKMELSPNSINKYVSFLRLYQTNKLNENINLYPENGKINLNGYTFDTIFVVNSLFKTLSFELFQLFKACYDLKTGKQKNNDIYKSLGWTYKELLYKLKGIFINKRIDGKKNEGTNFDHKLKIQDAYMCLKNIHMKTLVFLLKQRVGLLSNKVKNENLINCYKGITSQLDNKQLLISGLYITVLFQ